MNLLRGTLRAWLAQNKLALVAARRANDDELAKRLSHNKSRIRYPTPPGTHLGGTRLRWACEVCGEACRGFRCRVHAARPKTRLALALAFLGLASCTQIPPVPMRSTTLVAPKQVARMLRFQSEVQQGIQNILLSWHYPPDQMSSVNFQIYSATTLYPGPALTNYAQVPIGFALMLVTPTNSISLQSNLGALFFIVRAVDHFTNYSTWNTMTPITNGPLNVVLTAPATGEVVSNTITLKAIVVALPHLPVAPDNLTFVFQSS